jgi:hypothetical protein
MDHSQKTTADVNANASMGGIVVVEVVIGDVGTLQRVELGGTEVDSFGMPSCIVYTVVCFLSKSKFSFQYNSDSNGRTASSGQTRVSCLQNAGFDCWLSVVGRFLRVMVKRRLLQSSPDVSHYHLLTVQGNLLALYGGEG